jgi:hypothetical protein
MSATADWAGPRDWIYYVRPVKGSLGRGYWADGSMRWVSSAPTVAHDKCFTARHGKAPEDSRAYLAYSDRVRTIYGENGERLADWCAAPLYGRTVPCCYCGEPTH